MSSPNQHPTFHPTPRPPSPTPSQQPPPFQPFFTLIAPTPSNPSHSHPHVHYVFADDPHDPTLNPPAPGTRVLTVDLDESLQITSAHSLARDFQLVGAELKQAPKMDGGEPGVMLVLDGVEAGVRGVRPGAAATELGRVFDERCGCLASKRSARLTCARAIG